MADEETLEAIREKRLGEIRGQHEFSGQAEKSPQEQERQMKELKQYMFSKHLDQAAHARLANIRVAKPDKAEMLENLIFRMIRMGQIGAEAKVTEQQLKALLGDLSQKTQKTTTVKFDRRRAHMDDLDDDDF